MEHGSHERVDSCPSFARLLRPHVDLGEGRVQKGRSIQAHGRWKDPRSLDRYMLVRFLERVIERDERDERDEHAACCAVGAKRGRA